VPTHLVAILADQLLLEHPALIHAQTLAPKTDIQVVLVESQARLQLRPYQRHKLVLVLSALRHYAAALRAAGWQVTLIAAVSWRVGLLQACAQFDPDCIITMAGAEYNARRAQERWSTWLERAVTVLPNRQFLAADVLAAPGSKRQTMESFYRMMRVRYQLLIEADGAPVGGSWNYDAENRKPLPKHTPIPLVQRYLPDELTLQVIADVAAYPQAYGDATTFGLAVTHAQAEDALARFIRERLPDFGRYEDAMAADEDVLFHSVLSPYLNLGLLDPLTCARAAEAAYRAGLAPLAAVEGFIRQIVGWREYMYRRYWELMPELRTMNAWNATRPLPEWFWQGQSGMHCIDTVIARVWRTGYTHHIERLMILTNFCTLAGIDPVAVNEWFLAGYIDAYDWVMWPNVSGMGLNADGGLIATKPYISSGAYIKRMSNYCAGCRYDPAVRTGPDACPYTLLYWNFLLTHQPRLQANPRMGPAVLGLRHLDDAQRGDIQTQAVIWLERLSEGTSA
jgi:deoxyribodipyrimidine photolyase-related protein